jgi:predicted acetyltransferase
MQRQPEKLPPRIEILPATREHEPIVDNLLELYAHDFSEFHNIVLGPTGRFGYKNLSLYWRDPHRHPFLVEVDGRLAGVVLVKTDLPVPGREPIWDMAEFFIARGYRRHGVGTIVARKLWERFPGPWEIRVMEANSGAHQFWQKIITEFSGREIESSRIEIAGVPWRLFSFDSRRRAARFR